MAIAIKTSSNVMPPLFFFREIVGINPSSSGQWLDHDGVDVPFFVFYSDAGLLRVAMRKKMRVSVSMGDRKGLAFRENIFEFKVFFQFYGFFKKIFIHGEWGCLFLTGLLFLRAQHDFFRGEFYPVAVRVSFQPVTQTIGFVF